LREKGVDFEPVTPMGLGAGAGMEDFLAASPRGEVPALVDGDLSVFDSTIILEYIEDKWPTPPLLPATPAERARVRMIEEVMDTHYEAINWAMGEINWFRRAEGEAAEALKATAGRQTAGFLTWLERQLGARPWFNGESFGWGDLAVVPYVAASAGMGFRPPEGRAVATWLARALARPSVAETVGEARGFSTEGSGVAEAVAAGLFKREYRDHRLEWMMKSGGVDIVMKGLEAGNIRFTPDFS
ncbi:MAG TPA: glutathione S-transferase family protein, partial [Caulobacteraceae bacterium]|nr:glutathione S-transferase family protein [Caulobacteraceae bacterium]